MDFKNLMAISGQSGLFKYISQGRNGIIVESLTDKKRILVASSVKVSSLSDIAIFSDKEDIPLKKVLKSISEKENNGPAIDHKLSNDELKKYFETVLPNYDRERVYVSDMKKVISWYNTLQKQNLLDFTETEETKPEDNMEETKNINSGEPIKTDFNETAKKSVTKREPVNFKANSKKETVTRIGNKKT